MQKVPHLFDGDLTEHAMLAFANNSRREMLESDLLVQQAMNNTKKQFGNSPEFSSKQLNS